MSDDTPDTNFKVIDTRSPETRARVAGDHSPSITKMVELKPCPFCGMEPTVGYTEYWKAYDVHCDCELGPSTEMHTREEAIAAWNRRAPEPMTSVVRWTRYDGTPPTLPEANRNVLITREYNARCFTWYCLAELYDLGCGVYVWEPYEDGAEGMGDVEVGDLWAYLPQPPEGAE